MARQLEDIVQELKECFDGRPWYGISVWEKLGTIPWEMVNEKKYGSKTIAVLVRHIINWRIFILKKLEGDAEYDLVIDGPTDWTAIYIQDQQEWEALKLQLRQTQEKLIQQLCNVSDELLKRRVPGKDYTFFRILTSITQHDIYHLGQIAMLHAMQRS